MVTSVNRDKDDIDIDIEVTLPTAEAGKSSSERFSVFQEDRRDCGERGVNSITARFQRS